MVAKPPRASPMKGGSSDEMSKNELKQIIENQRREISHLQEKVRDLESEND